MSFPTSSGPISKVEDFLLVKGTLAPGPAFGVLGMLKREVDSFGTAVPQQYRPHCTVVSKASSSQLGSSQRHPKATTSTQLPQHKLKLPGVMAKAGMDRALTLHVPFPRGLGWVRALGTC